MPETTGVNIRRSVGSHEVSAICTKLQTTIRVANIAGPAAVIVVTMIAMNIAAGQASAMCPEPNRPRRLATAEKGRSCNKMFTGPQQKFYLGEIIPKNS